MSAEPVEHERCRGRTTSEQAFFAADVDAATAARWARAFHETYVRLAPHFGWQPPAQPAWNRAVDQALLTAVFRELIPLVEASVRQELHGVRGERDRWQRIVELLCRAAAGSPAVEHVAALAEAVARISALADRWEADPQLRAAAGELRRELTNALGFNAC